MRSTSWPRGQEGPEIKALPGHDDAGNDLLKVNYYYYHSPKQCKTNPFKSEPPAGITSTGKVIFILKI